MSDMHDETIRPFLTVDELRSVRVNPVKKDGVDPAAVAEIIARAAVTMETLLSVIDGMHRERAEILSEAQKNTSVSGQAARLLEAAASTAEDMVNQAQADADALVSNAHSEASAILAAQRADRDTISQEIADLRAALTAWRREISDVRTHVLRSLDDSFAEIDAMLEPHTDAPVGVAGEASTAAFAESPATDDADDQETYAFGIVDAVVEPASFSAASFGMIDGEEHGSYFGSSSD